MGNIILPIMVFWPICASIVSYLIGRRNKKMRDYFANAVTIVEFLLALSVIPTVIAQGSVYFSLMPFGHERLFFQMDGFRCIYGVITTFMWMCTTIFSREYFAHYRNRNRYYLFMLMTEGATVAVFLSGDVLTLFTFFEVMAFTSYVMVIHDEKPGAQRASETYTYLNVFGGLVTLMGIFLLYNTIGTLEIDKIKDACAAVTDRKMLYWAAATMIVGFGGKSGMFPLHVWLPKAHPVAPAPASAVLSGVITKAGVLAIVRVMYYMVGVDFLRGTWVQYVLLALTLYTVFMGSMLAFKEKLFKKRLAYSSVSQVSYVLFGLMTMHPLGFVGACLHMIAHAIVKNILFLSAGSVIYKTHKTYVTQLKGIGKEMPITMWCFTIASIALVGIPPTSGFESKWFLAIGALQSDIGIFKYLGPATLLVSAFLTAGYLLSIMSKAFFPGEDYPYDTMVKTEANAYMTIPMIILTVLAVGFGMFATPLVDFFSQIAGLIM